MLIDVIISEVAIGGTRSERPVAYMPQDTGATAVLTVYESELLTRMQGRNLRVQTDDLAQVERALTELNITALSDRDIGDLSVSWWELTREPIAPVSFQCQ